MAKTMIGTAGWSIPAQHAGAFPGEGSHHERYSRRFSAVEINSSFYRPHRPSTYQRWAATVPAKAARPRGKAFGPKARIVALPAQAEVVER